MGSSLTTGLEALLEAWEARDELTGVRILDRKIEEAADVESDTGMEAVWFDDMSITYEVPTMRAGSVEYEETIDIPVVIQVVREGGDNSDQLSVLRRAEEIYNGCLAAIMEDATLGVTSFRRFECTIESTDGPTLGRFQGDGHGARYRMNLVFVARVDADE